MFEYDATGQLVTTTFHDGTHEHWEHDNLGHPVTFVDRTGAVVRMIYDEGGREIARILPDATPSDPSDNPVMRAEYDAKGRRTATIDAAGRRTEFTYDAADQIVATKTPNGHILTREFDLDGRTIGAIDALGNYTQRTFDEMSRVLSETSNGVRRTERQYNNEGKLIATTNALGETYPMQ